MNKIAAAISIVFLFSFTPDENIYTIDKNACSVHWLGKKASGQHEGNVLLQSGSLKANKNIPVSGA